MKTMKCPKCQGLGGYPKCPTCQNKLVVNVRPDSVRVKCSPHWSPREMEVIEQLAVAKDIEPCHVVRCALRLYQMEHEGIIEVKHAKPLGCPDFPGEISGTNADVDLPDTAAQDSASKSNNPAVSG